MNPFCLSRLREVLEKDGIAAGLQLLNARVPHRFTGVYRLDGDVLHKAWLVDKRGSAGLPHFDEVPPERSVAQLALKNGEFETSDAANDPRLDHYRHLCMAGSCFALRLMDHNQQVWGMLLHFDMINRQLDPDEAVLLRQVPPLLSPLL